jgi:MFS transporter, MHS family, proline/betaine transporter
VYWISYFVNPLKILKVQLLISLMLVLSLPYLLNNISQPYHLITIQYLFIIFAIHGMPAFAIFYKYISILSRFTKTGLAYSFGRALMFGGTAFGLIYLVEWFGNWGIFGLFAVTLFSYTIALFYFDKLEKKSNA